MSETENLAPYPVTMTYSGVPPDERKHLGITAAAIRLSVESEDSDDLMADLDRALIV